MDNGDKPKASGKRWRRPFRPVYRPEDDTYCWICHGLADKQHCKIICRRCGFTRDCSDP